MHVLDQSCPCARFTWHRDTEENTAYMRVYYSLVLLLTGTGGQIAGLRVAGATKPAKYGANGHGHIFDAALFHTTELREQASGLKLGVFVGLWI